jgi:transposase
VGGAVGRFTALFEALAIEWLKAASQKAVAGLLKLSWDEIHGIMERAVVRGLKRRQAEPVTKLGVDEKAFRRGHHYFTFRLSSEALRLSDSRLHRDQFLGALPHLFLEGAAPILRSRLSYSARSPAWC